MRTVRFAPSPTGDLHLGHAWAAWCAHEAGRETGAEFIIRIEDIDQGRSREEFIDRQIDDLAWLGLASARPIWRQSERMPVYRQALDRLEGLGVVYPCFCTRAEIRRELAAMNAAPQLGDPSAAYTGRCRGLSADERAGRIGAGEAWAMRLDALKAMDLTGPLHWIDVGLGRREVRGERIGDVVIARKETPTSYHLSVVVDDHAQGVVRVTRGWDLIEATDVHRLLQALLGLDTPEWAHHALVVDDDGERLAKRRGGETLRTLRERGLTPTLVLEAARARAVWPPQPGVF